MLKFLSAIMFSLTITSLPTLASERMFGADFLQQLNPAEGNGMGETCIAYSVGARSLNNNPSGLAFGEGSEMLIGFHRSPRINTFIMKENEDGEWGDFGRYNIEPTELQSISYVLPRSRFGNLGLNFVFNYGGRYIRVNKEGKAINAFPRDDMILAIGYSLRISQIVSAGFDIKSIRSKIPTDKGDNIGRAYAMNAGIMYQIGKRARAGVVLRNIGNKLSFSEINIPSKLRRDLLVGGIYAVRDRKNSKLSLSMDVNPPFENGLRYNIGAELLYYNLLAFRIGYMRNTEKYYDPLITLKDGSSISDKRIWLRKGLTAGLGLKFKGTEVSIARAPRREPILDNNEKLRLETLESVTSFSFSAKF